VLDEVTGGLPTVGVRIPAHPLTLELLYRFGGGLAAPSANRFGRVSPTTAEHVRDDLGDDVDFVLDGGACPIGVESTIVDCTVDPPQVLRPGGIAGEDIAALLERALGEATGPSRAPGMLAAHYAPQCRVVLVDSPADARRLADSRKDVEILEEPDLVKYAHTLYTRLRDADDRGIDTVIAVLPPAAGLGHAIRDRLMKAAAGFADE
jgi:L-threonylcarbamoyladenylate synthase